MPICLFRRSHLAAVLLLAGVSSALPLPASANGRPPAVTGVAQASQLTAAQTSNTILLGLTFGAAISIDSGRSFAWTCENALGGPTSVDALIAAPNANTMLVGGIYGLRKSVDNGCTWQPALDLNGLQVEALAPTETQSTSWWVVANNPATGQGSLWRTQDDGQSYSQLPLTRAGLYFYGVAASLLNPNMLVVTAGNNGNGNSCVLLVSNDAGGSWGQSFVGGAPSASVTPRVTLSPTDKSRILITVMDASNGSTTVLLSTDYGQSFSSVAIIPELVRNASFSPDGTQVFVAGQTRLYRSTNAGQSFVQLTVPSGNACAMVDGGRLYACGDNTTDGFSLGISNDWGNSWDKLFGLPDLQGPYRCPTGTPTRDICMPEWTNEAAVIGAQAGPPAAAPPASAPEQHGCHCATLGQKPWGTQDAMGALMCVTLMARHWRRRRS